VLFDVLATLFTVDKLDFANGFNRFIYIVDQVAGLAICDDLASGA